jgi:taurine dioxygenase
MGDITVKPLGYALGGEITGVDLRQPLDEATKREIFAAWHKHLIVVFPGQNLSDGEFIAFSRQFGEMENDYATSIRDKGNPDLMLISNKPVDGKPSNSRDAGREWHSDFSYSLRPLSATTLLCKEKPDVGGDTMWANMYLAYESLSPRMKELIDKLEAVHDTMVTKALAYVDPDYARKLQQEMPPVIQPVVRVHPDTGRKALFIGERMGNIVGMREDESKAILALLMSVATAPINVYRHRWSLHDLVMWDNRCTIHIALPDYDRSQPRHMYRCSIAGTASGRLLNPPARDEKQAAMTM